MALPRFAADYLMRAGYPSVNPMREPIALWSGWFDARNNWYQYDEQRDGRSYSIDRISCRPARMACAEWASLLFTENVIASAGSDEATARIAALMASNSFRMRVGGAIERGFALGTAALAWRVSNFAIGQQTDPEARLELQRYGADDIVALSYNEDMCSEAAFCSQVTIGGKSYTQLQLYVTDGGVYHIKNALFDNRGHEVAIDGIIADFNTGSTTPPFALLRPAIENTYAEHTPYGVSIFDDAVGAIKVVDAYFDNLNRDVETGQMLVFIGEELIERDANGKAIIPRERNKQFFVPVGSDAATPGKGDLIKEWAPNLRTDQNRAGLETALRVFGMRTGFGSDYWAFDGKSGLKTATEVVSDQSQLYRTMRKHENVLEPALVTLLGSMLELEANLTGASYGNVGDISVRFDDSIIADTDAERRQDREDVAMGVMSAWEYRAKWYGEDETTAQAAVAAAAGTTATEPIQSASGL